MPVLVYVNYPKEAAAKFDMDYYLNKHMKLVETHWGPYGMKDWKIVQFRDGDASGLHVQAILTWDSFEAFDKAIEANIPEVMQDVKNYSTEMPSRYYAEIKAQG